MIMADGTEAAPQAGTEVDWVDQFSAHVEASYPQVFLLVKRSGIPRPDGERRPVIIDTIKVERDARGRGLARAVLTELCAQADRHGDTLTVSPSVHREHGWTAHPKKWARFFTSGLGFVSNRGSRGRDFSINETMYRKPRPITAQEEA